MDFSRYLGEVGLAELWKLMTSYVDEKIWIGTQSDYDKQVSNIKIGTIVIIIDEKEGYEPPAPEEPDIEDPTENEKPDVIDPTSISAKLGAALLGAMILGQD